MREIGFVLEEEEGIGWMFGSFALRRKVGVGGDTRAEALDYLVLV